MSLLNIYEYYTAYSLFYHERAHVCVCLVRYNCALFFDSNCFVDTAVDLGITLLCEDILIVRTLGTTQHSLAHVLFIEYK